MQVAAFVFVQRKWEEDKNHFEKMLDYFCDICEPLQLLIFPEGTDLTGRLHLSSSQGMFNMEILCCLWKEFKKVQGRSKTWFSWAVERIVNDQTMC